MGFMRAHTTRYSVEHSPVTLCVNSSFLCPSTRTHAHTHRQTYFFVILHFPWPHSGKAFLIALSFIAQRQQTITFYHNDLNIMGNDRESCESIKQRLCQLENTVFCRLQPPCIVSSQFAQTAHLCSSTHTHTHKPTYNPITLPLLRACAHAQVNEHYVQY